VHLQCDGVDVTPKLRQFKFHCILFLNIPYYAGGAQPWGGATSAQQSASTVPSVRYIINVLSLHILFQPNTTTTQLCELGAPTSPYGVHKASNVSASSANSSSSQFTRPSISDGLIEVLGFTTASLVAPLHTHTHTHTHCPIAGSNSTRWTG
jgi:hypothetical protein